MRLAKLLLLLLFCGGQLLARPNFLIVFTDDQTFRATGYHNLEVKTPHLDALAQEGLIFEHAYVASPICAASRASLLTGLFPQSHGVVALESRAFKAFCRGGLREGETLPAALAQGGYRTALFGKSHLGLPTNYHFSEGQELADEEAFSASAQFVSRCAQEDTAFCLLLAPHVSLHPAQRWLDIYQEDSLLLPGNFRPTPCRIA